MSKSSLLKFTRVREILFHRLINISILFPFPVFGVSCSSHGASVIILGNICHSRTALTSLEKSTVKSTKVMGLKRVHCSLLGSVQTSNFSCAESNVNEEDPLSK